MKDGAPPEAWIFSALQDTVLLASAIIAFHTSGLDKRNCIRKSFGNIDFNRLK